MKILLVAEREELGNHVRLHFQPQGSEIIQYWNPIKAMDNLDEIDPDVVLFSAKDFPRHWKTFLNFLRATRTRQDSVFVVLKGDEFPYEEASKAQQLDVNGIVHENLEDRHELGRLREIVVRYKEAKETRHEKRYLPSEHDRIGFAFSHPETLQIITGTVEDISTSGLRFTPDSPELVTDVEPGSILQLCSLRIGEQILAVQSRVVRFRGSVSLELFGLTDRQKERIESYLADHTRRELQAAARKG